MERARVNGVSEGDAIYGDGMNEKNIKLNEYANK